VLEQLEAIPNQIKQPGKRPTMRWIFQISLWPGAISCSGHAGLYETLTKALQSEEFHYSLWPGAILRSGHAGYTKEWTYLEKALKPAFRAYNRFIANRLCPPIN